MGEVCTPYTFSVYAIHDVESRRRMHGTIIVVEQPDHLSRRGAKVLTADYLSSRLPRPPATQVANYSSSRQNCKTADRG